MIVALVFVWDILDSLWEKLTQLSKSVDHNITERKQQMRLGKLVSSPWTEQRCSTGMCALPTVLRLLHKWVHLI